MRITARSPEGLFRGTQTLRQLLPPRIESPTPVADGTEWTLAPVTVEDRPRSPRPSTRSSSGGSASRCARPGRPRSAGTGPRRAGSGCSSSGTAGPGATPNCGRPPNAVPR
ncbi:glycoside hydrolase family 20 zincin-like fold domain-containing protein [Kitasatospora purpeofusca]|uniref:glycoside hydrolase family 20 zincin-like fold domain-containing protein n=1 Tax=Kitasatospora purpeofusca TaxID=67352 RepID=UPI00386915E1